MTVRHILLKSLVFLGLFTFARSNAAQDVAVFKLPQTPRQFMFQFKRDNTQTTSIEGVETIFAVEFTALRTKNDDIELTFTDALYCRAQSGTNTFPAIAANKMTLSFPFETRVLVKGKWLKLRDLTEKAFEASVEGEQVFEGAAATNKLKELGLPPPPNP